VTHKIKTLLLFSACATVLSMFTAAADTCANVFNSNLSGNPASDTLAYLIANNVSCTFGGFTFSNFGYTDSSQNAGNTGPGQTETAADVTVATDSNAYGNGLAFNSSWNADGGEATSDGDITFTVTSNNGGTEIEDAGLAVTSGEAGNGISKVDEKGCSGAGCTPGTWGVETFDTGSGGSDTSNYIFNVSQLNPSVTVSKDINAAANGGSDLSPYDNNAGISQVVDTFSVVPEPRALSLLLGFGIIAGLLLRKKFQGANA
jgi:hypothetical protein